MRIFAILALVIGVFMAGGAVKYMYDQFRMMEARYSSMSDKEPVETVMIAVAAEELRYGKKIGEDSIRLVEWPKAAAPENGFNTIEDLFKQETQRTVLRQMEVNEPILRSKVTGFGERATVEALLNEGMRAHTLPVDTQSSVAGFLRPGSRIDIYLTYGGGANLKTRRLMEAAQIIAVDQTTDPDEYTARVARTVTLEVTPTDSQRLVLAQRIGNLSFNLRGMSDEKVVSPNADGEEPKDLSVKDLLGIEEVVKEVDEKGEVKVRRGGRIGESIEVDQLEADEAEKDGEAGDEKKEPASN